MQKIRTRQEAKPEQSKTLQDLVNNELAEKSKTASEGLLWLVRFFAPPPPSLASRGADRDKAHWNSPARR